MMINKILKNNHRKKERGDGYSAWSFAFFPFESHSKHQHYHLSTFYIVCSAKRPYTFY